MNEIANAGRAVHPFRRNRAILFSLLALVLVVLSFHGVLDNLAFSKLDDLIKETLGLLVVFIGFDAIISIFETVEIPYCRYKGGPDARPSRRRRRAAQSCPDVSHRLAAPAGSPAQDRLGIDLRAGISRYCSPDRNQPAARTVGSRPDRSGHESRDFPLGP